MLPALNVAKKIIEISNSGVFYCPKEVDLRTVMRLDMLVYVAHAYCIAFTGERLVNEMILAGASHPTIPALEHQLNRMCGGYTTMENIKDVDLMHGQHYAIHKAAKDFSGIATFEMKSVLCQDGSPWHITVKQKKWSVIPDALLGEYYKW